MRSCITSGRQCININWLSTTDLHRPLTIDHRPLQYLRLPFALNCDMRIVTRAERGHLDFHLTEQEKLMKRSFGKTAPITLVMALALAGLLLVGPNTRRVSALAGDLDPTFGSLGKVTTNFVNSDQARAIVVQPDGKLLVAGSANAQNEDFGLARYGPTGALDPSFGVFGKVTTDLGSSSERINALALQADGKIVAAGSSFRGVATQDDFALARYNSDGSLDATFGSAGIVFLNFFGGAGSDQALSVAIQPDGKIVAAGYATGTQGRDFAIARYNSDGSPDSTFNFIGRIATGFPGAVNDEAHSIAVQSDGKLVAAGLTTPAGDENFALVRYNPDATLDTTFGVGGLVSTDIGVATTERGSGAAIQSDGKIIVAGQTFPGSAGLDFALVRYNPDGSLDPTFGSSGKVTTDFFGDLDSANALALQSDGKIVVAGRAQRTPDLSSTEFALARYNTDGSLDSTFGISGRVATDFFGNDDQAWALAIQPNGKIVAAGHAANSGIFDRDFSLARYDAEAAAFDMCLQDETNGWLIEFDSIGGSYEFTDCQGLILAGVGTLSKRGCLITLQHNAADRRVLVRFDGCRRTAIASVQVFSPARTFSITDRNTANNSCACPGTQ
jgi:uncharacterized delta-60 repeat protein